MDQERSFLEAIRRRPGSRATRRVYADWLTDRGDPRGEFIQLQCEAGRLARHSPRRLALQARIDELLLQNEAGWLGPLLGAVGNWEWKDGLLDWVTVRADVFLANAERWLPALPLLGVHLRKAKDHVGALARCPQLARLSGLYLGDNELTDEQLAELLGSPHLKRLTTLFLQSNLLGEEGAAALAGTPNLPRLAELNLGHNRLRDGGVVALAGSMSLGRLRALHLTMTGMEEPGLRALIGSPLFARLRLLAIGMNRMQPGALAELAAAPGLAGTRVLVCDLNQIGDGDVAALAGSPHAVDLRCLALEAYETLGNAALTALAASPHLGRLRALSLGSGPWGPAGVRALGRSRTLRSLRSLHLTQSNQRSEGVAAALLGSPLARRLGDLALRIGGGIGPAGLEVLASRRRPVRLRRLEVACKPETLGPWAELAGRGTLGRLTGLTLSDVLPGAVRVLLGPDRFGELRDLTLYGVPDVQEFQALLDSPLFARLHGLRIGLRYGDEEKAAPELLRRLTAAWGGAALRRVELAWSLHREQVGILTAASPPPVLVALEVGVLHLKAEGMAELAAWPGLGQVRRLVLANASSNTVPGLAALADSPHVGPLLRVDIRNGHAPPEAAPPVRPALRRL
jgi:uncharacterized protein (TIGR02996 family)